MAFKALIHAYRTKPANTNAILSFSTFILLLVSTLFITQAAAATGVTFHGKDVAYIDYLGNVRVCDREDDGADAFIQVKHTDSNRIHETFANGDFACNAFSGFFAISYRICETGGPERSYATCNARWVNY